LDLLDAVRDLQSAGHPVTLESIARRLEVYGIHVPPSAVHVSSMRLWLEKAGVFRSLYEIAELRVEELVGASPSDLEALAGLDELQRDFLKALATLGEGPHEASRIREHARSLYGTDFPYKSMPKAVLDSLQIRGYIKTTKTTGGRGAKSYTVEMTDRIRDEYFIPLMDYAENAANLHLRGILRKPLTQLVSDLAADDRDVKGRALEALAVRLRSAGGIGVSCVAAPEPTNGWGGS
jgi:site-specific DNA-methyltransferase (cytosine-N4-specific)